MNFDPLSMSTGGLLRLAIMVYNNTKIIILTGSVPRIHLTDFSETIIHDSAVRLV